MLTSMRRRLEMAVRARDFTRAHPYTDPSHQAVAARFGDLVTRAQALAVQEQAGRLGSAAATRYRRTVRSELEGALIRYLTRVADLAARENPELAGRFRMPKRRLAHAAFLARGWDFVTLAREHQDLLGRHGLSANHLDDLTSALNRFEGATERANAARREHVGARAELRQVATELTEVLGLLHVLNTTRFASDAEQLAAWISARNVLGPFRRKADGNGSTPPNGGTADLAA